MFRDVDPFGSDQESIPHSTEKHGSSAINTLTVVKYPLAELGLQSATQSYEKGFWQRTEPVPLSRWKTILNQTCTLHDSDSNDTIIQYPRRDEKFDRRVPFVAILGTQKGGTTALANYLYTHKHIQQLRTKELRYFDETLDQDPKIIVENSAIPARKALRMFQEQAVGSEITLEVLEFSTQLLVVDATPNYLFFSDRVPKRLLCIAPWIKLLVLLRNPVDRAFSQYNMQLHRDLTNPDKRRGFVTFEEYVEMDMQVLRDLGVIPNTTTVNVQAEIEGMLLSPKVLEGWATYTKLGLNSPIGRGLYSIQLTQWMQSLQDAGKKLNLQVLQSEEMYNNTKAVFDQVLEHLGLPAHTLPKFGKIHATTYRDRKMNPETRVLLESFFRPYNRQLEQIMGHEWHDVWE
jgi:hypothetical protein